MSTSTPVQFLQPDVVADLIRSEKSDKVVVVDVRGEDFAGGHVKGAKNIVSDEFYDVANVDKIIDEKLAGAEKIIVHCMKSQQRGPSCANKLAERLAERGINAPEVFVLAGGYNTWSSLYSGHPDLVEGHEAGTSEK